MNKAKLSILTFGAIEQLEMWADVVKHKTGKDDPHLTATIKGLKDYRVEQGWNPNGFGGEE